MNHVSVRNLQRTRNVQATCLRRFTLEALHLIFPDQACSISVRLLGNGAMARLNRRFLDHDGSTDIITFDYTGQPGVEGVDGELCISMDDAVTQARTYGTTWAAELARYVVHGLLHLRGYDDRQAARKRRMRTAENQLLNRLARSHPFQALAGRASGNRLSRAFATRRPSRARLPSSRTSNRRKSPAS